MAKEAKDVGRAVVADDNEHGQEDPVCVCGCGCVLCVCVCVGVGGWVWVCRWEGKSGGGGGGRGLRGITAPVNLVA